MLPQYKRIASFGMKRTISKSSQILASVGYGSTDTVTFPFQVANEMMKWKWNDKNLSFHSESWQYKIVTLNFVLNLFSSFIG